MAGPVDSYAVMGNPVMHSKSPLLHTLFADQVGHAIRYSTIEVALDGFVDAVNAFFDNGDIGISITAPFKEQALAYAHCRTPRAEQAGAVNTLWKNVDGRICGDNTDGIGLVNDLTKNHHLELKGMRVLMLGAGGAVRGVLMPLLERDPELIVVANRTESKAKSLAEAFNDSRLVSQSLESLDQPFDLIINGTSASLKGEMLALPSSIVGTKTYGYDMVYSARPTPFNAWCLQQGAIKVMDGLGMLVEQAAEQFTIWRKEAPNTLPVLELVRQDLMLSA